MMRIPRRVSRGNTVQGLGPQDPVPDGYPFQLSDERLDAVLRDMLSAIPGFDRYQALLPELKLQLILVGFQERARRNSERVARQLLIVAWLAEQGDT